MSNDSLYLDMIQKLQSNIAKHHEINVQLTQLVVSLDQRLAEKDARIAELQALIEELAMEKHAILSELENWRGY